MSRKIKPIPSAGPSISELEVRMVADAARTGWYESRNNYLEKFIKKSAQLTKRQYVLPTAHCTDAIHLALLSLGIGKGDEVIVPDVSWIASASPITYVGATPVFADIEESTWCLSPKSLEKNITKRTKAVIVVDLYGGMPRMKEILSIARKHRIAVIEDAAEALGSSYGGKPAAGVANRHRQLLLQRPPQHASQLVRILRRHQRHELQCNKARGSRARRSVRNRRQETL